MSNSVGCCLIADKPSGAVHPAFHAFRSSADMAEYAYTGRQHDLRLSILAVSGRKQTVLSGSDPAKPVDSGHREGEAPAEPLFLLARTARQEPRSPVLRRPPV